jgi:hypothetical protein
MASRGKLVDDVTRTALGSASLTAEDRVLARQRVQQVIATASTKAHREVIAGSGPTPDTGAAETPAARKLAAELLAADDRTKGFGETETARAEQYIAQAITAAADEEARRTPSGGSQQPPAAAAGAAASAAAGAAAAPAAAVAAPVVAAVAGVAGVKAIKDRGPSERRLPPSR